MKINKLQGLLLVIAGIVLLSAMCFCVVFANFAITDKVANAEEAMASADVVPFVIGESYNFVCFDIYKSINDINAVLSMFGSSFNPIVGFDSQDNAQGVMVIDYSEQGLSDSGYGIFNLTMSVYFFSSVDLDSPLGYLSSGWNFNVIDSDGVYYFSDYFTVDEVNNLSIISSQPFESESDPPHTFDDNLAGINVGDSAITIIPDLSFEGNVLYQDDFSNDFPIAEFSVNGVYNAYISVIGTGVSYKYSFCIYENSLIPIFRVDLYRKGVEDFGYYIDEYLNLDITYVGLTDVFYEMGDATQQECYRFLNSLSFTSYVPSVDLYQDLLNRYNSLDELYQDLLEQFSFVNIVNNIGTAVTYANFGTTYRSSGVISGLFLNSVPIYYSENNLSSTYGDILAMPLGGVYSAGTKFRFNYYMIGMGNQHTVAINGGVHVGYVNDGALNAIFTTDDSNCWAVGRSNFEIEFTLPVDTNVLYFYCENTSNKAHIYLSDVKVSVLSSDVNVLIEQAFQRGVDSVNVNDITKRAEEAGYYRGLSEQNSYTFRSLMGAVVDAPLDVFTQMFDFDILGVNMKGLYLSLFTLALVILVIKFALARG